MVGTALTDYHPCVVEANLADIHGWGLLEISPGCVDHLNIVHLVPYTTSTCRAAAITQLLSSFHGHKSHRPNQYAQREIIEWSRAAPIIQEKGKALLLPREKRERDRSMDRSKKINKDSFRNMQCGDEPL